MNLVMDAGTKGFGKGSDRRFDVKIWVLVATTFTSFAL